MKAEYRARRLSAASLSRETTLGENRRLSIACMLAASLFLEGPQEINFPPMLFDGVSADYKKAIQLAHRRGLKIIQYTAFPAIGAPSLLSDQFVNEWEQIPVGVLPYPRRKVIT